jgi:hypothetical protein
MTTKETTIVAEEATPRELAIKQLKKRRDFYGHVLVYCLVNSFLVVIWAIISVHSVFWPIFPMLIWGVGLILNAWDVYRSDTFSEERIQREIEHQRRRG